MEKENREKNKIKNEKKEIEKKKIRKCAASRTKNKQQLN